jgi:hypothetical protein
MEGFEEEFMKVEKDGERVGWMKVCPVLLSITPSIPPSSSPCPRQPTMDEILTNSDSASRHLRTPIIEI